MSSLHEAVRDTAAFLTSVRNGTLSIGPAGGTIAEKEKDKLEQITKLIKSSTINWSDDLGQVGSALQSTIERERERTEKEELASSMSPSLLYCRAD